jgi:hypothetical protein
MVVRTILEQNSKKHTTGGIPRWSPTLVLVARFNAYVWQSGRDAQFSLTYGRMCYLAANTVYVRETIASEPQAASWVTDSLRLQK